MTKGLISKAEVTINSPLSKVWDALINPETIKQYMVGTNVVSDWKEGSPIVWKVLMPCSTSRAPNFLHPLKKTQIPLTQIKKTPDEPMFLWRVDACCQQ